MKRILLSLIFVLPLSLSFAQQGIYTSKMSHCDNLVNQFMAQYDIPGATFAMAKEGKLVYMRSFGTADLGKTEATQPYHMFRIMSVSKSVTGIAVMKLVELRQRMVGQSVQ